MKTSEKGKELRAVVSRFGLYHELVQHHIAKPHLRRELLLGTEHLQLIMHRALRQDFDVGYVA